MPSIGAQHGPHQGACTHACWTLCGAHQAPSTPNRLEQQAIEVTVILEHPTEPSPTEQHTHPYLISKSRLHLPIVPHGADNRRPAQHLGGELRSKPRV